MSTIPPLLPKLDAVLVLDGDGNRLAGKYYGTFLNNSAGSQTSAELRRSFEQQLHAKISANNVIARPDAAEVVSAPHGRTAVVCSNMASGPDAVRIVHVGPPGESELVLGMACEGMYDALSQLMGGTAPDRSIVLDNLELVFLLIDEHCDGGILLEVDGRKMASAVLLRDEDTSGVTEEHAVAGHSGGNTGGGLVMPQSGAGDMTLGQAFRQARDQFMAGMTSRDGM